MHVAKGLEFPFVVISGLEETIFPHKRALADEAELEEERRLCYVGITRAMKHLLLTQAWTRTMWGQRSDAIPSRFLQEIPAELLDDISKTQPTRRATFRDEDLGFEGRSSTFSSGSAFGSRAAPPVRSTGAENLTLKVGDRVIHDRYGYGTVTKTSGTGTGARATVQFDDHGSKQLMLAMTPLRMA